MKPWYTEIMPKTICSEFVKTHPVKDMDALRDIAMTGDLLSFRALCNCLAVHQYEPKAFYSLPYEEETELRKLCNDRIHAMLGDLDEVYERLFKVQKAERWGGDETYKLYAEGFKPYDEAGKILTAVDLSRYFMQPLTFEMMGKINDLYSHGRYWELYVEDTYSFDIEIPKQFDEANRRRKVHMQIWHKFMDHVWNGNLDAARQLIDEYDKMHEKWAAAKRAENAKKGA